MMARQEMERTIKLLATCRKAFPQSKADGETLALYARALEPLGYGAIEAAVMRCLRTARFFPTIAEIYDAAESVQRTATNTGTPEAGEAWEEAMQNVRRNHVYKPWVFSCPEVKQAVKQFGKMELIGLEEDAMNTARAQFMRIYNGILRRRAEKQQNKQILQCMGTRARALFVDTAARLSLPEKDE